MAVWIKWICGIISALLLFALVFDFSKKLKRVLVICAAGLGIITAILAIPEEPQERSTELCTTSRLLDMSRQVLADPLQGPVYKDSIAAMIDCVKNSYSFFAPIDSAILLLAEGKFESLFGYLNALNRFGFTGSQADSLILLRGLGFGMWVEDSRADSSLHPPKGGFDSSKIYVEQYLTKKPIDATAWFYLGIANKETNQLGIALSCYDRAISLDPKFSEAFNNRGTILNELDRNIEAIASYNTAIRIKPSSPLAYHNRGIAQGNLQKYEEAIASYDTAIILLPNYAQAWYDRGVALWELGRHEEEIRSCDEAIKYRPSYTKAWCNRGEAFRVLGNYHEALKNFEGAIATDSSFADAWCGAGFCFARIGRPGKALDYFQRALKCAPANWKNTAGVTEVIQTIEKKFGKLRQ